MRGFNYTLYLIKNSGCMEEILMEMRLGSFPFLH